MPANHTPAQILKTVFGYDQFKSLQSEIIANVLKKRDTLAIMPTGGGKSLCYQIPALIFPGLTVVVSPLIALMKDQVEQLLALGVPALFLNSSLPPEEYQQNMRRVRSGQVKLLYVAPETLLTTRLFDLLSEIPFDCLTIDEAHCISEWGHDFRPEYRQLVEVRNRFPQAVCLALTATATPRVRQDIQTCLHFESSNEFIASFNRENLFIEVQPKVKPALQTLQFLERFPGQSGIVYCFARSQVDSLATILADKGYSVRPYHAGLESEERKTNQELFIRDDVQIIVATIAFGMGINKPNVRFIIHYDLPKSMEGYYQEIGRAGRDGLPAHCLLLFSYGDAQKLKFFIDEKEEPERTVAYEHLNALIRYAESDVCRRKPLLAYFGEQYHTPNCGMCDNCFAGEKEQVEITIPAQKFLSCVKRTGEKFSPVHVSDVLRGSKGKIVLQYDHQKLSTWGIGKDLSRKQWQDISRQLVQQGLLEQDDSYGTLKLTQKAFRVLKNKEPIWGKLLLKEVMPTRHSRNLPAGVDAELFEILRQKRKALADAEGVPPYIVFSDRTLAEIATFYPMSPASLMKINGVGQVKFQRYGQTFIELVRAYCQPRRLVEKPRMASQNLQTTFQLEPGCREIQVGEAFNAGRSVQALAEDFHVKTETILSHLFRFFQSGRSLRQSDEFIKLIELPPEQMAAALDAFDKLGTEYLKPVFDELGGAINYDQLRILRLHFISQSNH